jgi:arginyl-tRNA synthetase
MTAVLKFKQSIANQLSKHTPCITKDLITFMRPTKNCKEGHLSIALPKLNAALQDPVPKQELPMWAKTIAERVSLK